MTPIRPMLATEVTTSRLQALVEDDNARLELKIDGHRVIIHVESGKAKAFGRNGQPSQHEGLLRTRRFAEALAPVNVPLVLDCELVGDTFHVFDLPVAGYPLDITLSSSFETRREALERLFSFWAPNPALFRLVHSASTTEEKARLAADCVEAQVEGVMAKFRQAPYKQGPTRSPSVLKIKFTKDIELEVTGLRFEGRDNCILSCYRDGERVTVGRAKTSARHSPKIGEVWTVRYLHLGVNGKLVNPRLIRKRTDKDASECDYHELVRANKEVIA